MANGAIQRTLGDRGALISGNSASNDSGFKNAVARFMVFVSHCGFKGRCSTYRHCIAGRLHIKLQPCCVWSKRQPYSGLSIRTEYNLSLWTRSFVFGSTWIPGAAKSGRSLSADLGLDMYPLESTMDKNNAVHKEPQNTGSPANVKIVNNADTPTDGDTKLQSLSETLSLGGDSNGGSVQGLPEWAIGRTEGSFPPKLLTLVIIHKDGKVLLGMKKRGFGKGYFNGFGGKVEKGETIDEAAARELQEESGVSPVDMSKRGILKFFFDNDPIAWEVHVYHVSEILGDPCETEEMKPRWFLESEIPYETMWSDDVIWYPEFLKDRHFNGSFYFENTTTLVAHSLQVISA